MAREKLGYRDNLQDILEFFGGRRLLSKADVKKYTGVRDYRTLDNRFPFTDGRISAPVLARCLSPQGGEQ